MAVAAAAVVAGIGIVVTDAGIVGVEVVVNVAGEHAGLLVGLGAGLAVERAVGLPVEGEHAVPVVELVGPVGPAGLVAVVEELVGEGVVEETAVG